MTSTGLKITRGNTLELPLAAATEVITFLATRGAGKSFAGASIAEELYAALIQFVIIDPMGVYWGLRSSRDGSKGGLKVTILGGEQGDVPLEPTSGRLVADVVVDSGQSFILDLSLFDSKADQVRFMEAFCERIFYRKGPIEQRTPLTIIVDEADEFAPQKPEKNETKMLAHMIRLAKRGRTRGIGLVPLTQRSAEFHKGILDLSSAVVFMRTAGPRDRAAIKKWLAGSAPELLDLVDARFPKLDTGEGLVYSPHFLRLEEPVEVRFRMIRTFDSYKTPEPGQARPAPAKSAAIDLDALGEQIKATVERAKENDPAELRKQVQKLRRDLDAQKIATDTLARRRDDLERDLEQHPAEPERVEVPVLTDKQIERLEQIVSKLGHDVGTVDNVATALRAVSDGIRVDVLEAVREAATRLPAEPVKEREEHRPARPSDPRPPVSPPTPRPPAPQTASSNGSSADISAPQQTILDALAWFESVGVPAPRRPPLAAVAGVSSKASGFRANVSTLSGLGLLNYPDKGRVALTDQGRERARPPAYMGSTTELQEAVYRMVSGPQADLLRILVTAYPEPLDRETLADRAGVSHLASGFRANVSTLSGFELLTYPGPGLVRAADLLFLEEAIA